MINFLRHRFYFFIGLVILGSCLFSGSAFARAMPYMERVPDLTGSGWFTVVLFSLTFIALVWELFPPELVMFSTAAILTVTGIVSPTQFLEGFSKDIIGSILMLCIIVRAVELSGILSFISKHVLSKSKSNTLQLLSFMLPVGASSAFMNNTPIVLLMTSVVRQWALERKLSPSKFLIPLSYAAILGGVCTLIGTSSNLIIDGLLRGTDANAALSFFELSKIGLPCALAGLLYIITIGHRLLPVRKDPTSSLVETTQEFTSEFLVAADCELVGKTLLEAGQKHFVHELLIEIERDDYVLDSPSPNERIREGDRLIFAGDIKHIAELHAIEGLRSTADPHFRLDVTSPHFSEAVISVTSSLVGKTLKKADFRNKYGASVLAVYRQGRRVPGSVGEVVLRAGDTLMLLSRKAWGMRQGDSSDFFFIRHNEQLSLFSPKRFALVLTVLVSMIIAVIVGTPLFLATMVAAMVLLATRNISMRQAMQSIRLGLLVLIGSSFALGTALQKTGVASAFGEGIIAAVGDDPTLLIATIFVVTALVTAFVTNTAAVLLLFPIAIETAQLAGYTSSAALKAIGITITVAASCSFATPIGYQTNMIVYGPGGYRFRDYLRVGLPLNIIIFIICVILIPRLWPIVP